MDESVSRAHRVLRAVIVEGRQAREFEKDIALAGPAFVGVLNAFFRNVVERPFSGQESVATVQGYLERLQRAYPQELARLEPGPMALFVAEQIGPGAPPPGQSRLWALEGGVIHQMRLIAEYAARYEGIVGEELELYLRGSCARYLTQEY
ncbi:hypothetical protein [Streptacidiphilus jiangxiensis]|uniref:Uncharacterized protein n=1 Tax=Streptacidiphilus jiangxiensis TaxID=235985 RepID=A0A1H7YDV8_STRJI|nr:hypothetical protein [Streptacidiphilus jiangxiensis]SEM44145.1 hypothetical protein SAMN05414137_12835 [Streptacidiphilus jiangxiensis]